MIEMIDLPPERLIEVQKVCFKQVLPRQRDKSIDLGSVSIFLQNSCKRRNFRSHVIVMSHSDVRKTFCILVK